MRFMFVFPGQGSQSVGMMASYEGLPAIRETFAEASDVLGEDLWEMAQSGPAERLSLTVNTQPLMLTAGVAVWRAWRALGGPEPALLAGHSLGEYTALVAAESLSFADALPLVRLRAQAMQEAVPAGVGAMAAVMGLDAAAVETVCRQAAAETGETVALKTLGLLTLMAQGLSNAEVAGQLWVEPGTVKTHVSRILHKTDTRDRSQAIALAYVSGLVTVRR